MNSPALTIGPVESNPHRVNRSARYLNIYLILLAIAGLLSTNLIFGSYEKQFWVLSGFVAIHNIAELIALYRVNSDRFWITPVVLGSIVIFFMQLGGITNFLYTDPDGLFITPYNDLMNKEPWWLTRTMGLILIASVFYWFGYKLKYARLGTVLYMQVYSRFWNFPVSHYMLLIGLCVGWSIKLILNQYGAIGFKFGLIVQKAGSIPGLIYRLKVFEDLSLLFMIIFMFMAYTHRKNYFYWIVFGLAVLFEVVFALTTGARSSILYVFIGIFLVDFYFKKRIRIGWIIGGPVMFIFAMTVLQSFKEYALNPGSHVTTVTDPIEYLKNANVYRNQLAKKKKPEKAIKRTLFLNAVGRLNYVNETAQVVRYKKVVGLQPDDPDFFTPMWTFPVFAILPKYFLFGIESQSIGGWAAHLLAGSRKYSIAISPVGYSFLAGGTAMVALVFLFLGMLMKAGEGLLRYIGGVVAFILYFSILRLLFLFDTEVWTTFLNLIRYGILLPPLLWVLFRKWKLF